MSETTEAKVIDLNKERLERLKAMPIDYSDIPEMTDEELSRAMIRLPNQPVGKGGEWHKPPFLSFSEISEERLEQLKAKARAEKPDKEGTEPCALPATDKSASPESAEEEHARRLLKMPGQPAEKAEKPRPPARRPKTEELIKMY